MIKIVLKKHRISSGLTLGVSPQDQYLDGAVTVISEIQKDVDPATVFDIRLRRISLGLKLKVAVSPSTPLRTVSMPNCEVEPLEPPLPTNAVPFLTQPLTPAAFY